MRSVRKRWDKIYQQFNNVMGLQWRGIGRVKLAYFQV